MPYIATFLIALITLIAGIFGVANYATLGDIAQLSVNKELGTTLTTITSATKISDLATILPANFNALNDGKIENSSSSIAAITTLQNLTSVGTIATGVWSGTVIAVNKGGTGTTTPTSNMVILGDGTLGFKVVSGFGTSGQFLTSNGASAAPTWQTSAVNLTDNYAWTGFHSFSKQAIFSAGIMMSATSTLTATSTFIGRLTNTSAAIDGTASTTVYGDLKVLNGSLSATTIYGGKYPCIGQLTLIDSTGNYTNNVSCSFAPKFIIFEAAEITRTSGSASSNGISDGTNNFALAQFSGTANPIYPNATSSVYIFYIGSGTNYGLYGSTTLTTTGFTFKYQVINSGANGNTAVNYVAY